MASSAIDSELFGAFFAPNPKTVTALARMRSASAVKSPSLEAMQMPSSWRPFSMSTASMVSFRSAAFLPSVIGETFTGVRSNASICFVHAFMRVPLK